MSSNKIKLWLQASRPKTLPAAAAPVIIGTALAYQANSIHPLSALAALFGALFIQIGTNLANDYFDFKKGIDSENRLGPTRVTQAGLIAPESVKKGIYIAFGLAFFIGIYLVFRGGIPIVVIGLLSILFGLLYTGGPYPIGYIGLGDIFVLIFFGPVAVGGTFYVQTLSINSDIIIVGLAPGLFSTAILVVNNLRDIDNDKLSGKKTLAVRFGAMFSKFQFLFLLVAAFTIPIYLYFTSNNIYLFLVYLVIIPSIFVIKNLFTKTGKELNKVLSQTGQLLFFFAVLFSIGLLL